MPEIRKAYVDTSVGQVHYRYGGTGKDNLLLLHRTPVTSEIYEPLMRLLAPRFWMLAIDNIGFGMSAAPPRQSTFGDHTDVMLEVLDALQVSKTHIFGHHTGAAIGCELAVIAPARVRKLFLSAPPFFEEARRGKHRENITTLEIKEDYTYLTLKWKYRPVPGGTEVDLDARCQELAWRLLPGCRFWEGPGAVYAYDMAKRLPLIQAPTLVMSGEHDSLRQYVEPTAQLVRGSRQLIVPDAVTRMEIRHATELADIITEFVDEKEAKGSR